MTKNKKKLRRAERRYSVTKSAQTLVLAGMLLAGGVSGAMATAWTSGNLTATTVYDTATPNEVTETDVKFSATGSVLFNTGLTITGASDGAVGKITVGNAASEILNIKSALNLTNNGSADAQLLLSANGASVNLISADANAFTITGTDATNSKLTITNGTLTAYTNTGSFAGAVYTPGTVGALTLSGPMTVTVTATDGKIVTTDLVVENGAQVTEGNAITVDGTGGVANKLKSLTITGNGSKYTDSAGITLDGTGATVTVQDKGELAANSTITKGTLLLSAGDAGPSKITGNVTLNGSATTDATLNVTGGTQAAANIITGKLDTASGLGGTINVGSTGASAALEVQATGSKIGNGTHDSNLTVHTGSLLLFSHADGLTIDSKGTVSAQSLKLSNTSAAGDVGLVSQVVNINSGGVLDIKGNLELAQGDIKSTGATTGINLASGGVLHVKNELNITNTSSDVVAVVGGTVMSDTLKVGDGTKKLTWEGGTLALLGAAGSQDFLKATGGLVIDKGGIVSLGMSGANAPTTNGGTYTGALTFGTNGGSANTLNVAAGEWTLTNNSTALDLGANGTLTVANDAKLNLNLGAGKDLTVKKASGLALSDTSTLNLTGNLVNATAGTIKLDDTSTLDVTGNLTAAVSDGVTVNGGTLKVSGTATVTGAGTNGGLYVNGGAVEVQGLTDIGTSGVVNVASGSLTTGSIQTIAGSGTSLVGDGTNTATLTVAGNTAGTSVKTVDNKIQLAALGTVVMDAAAVANGVAAVTGVGKIDANNTTGVLKLNNYGLTITKANYDLLKTALLSNGGTLRLEGTAISGIVDGTNVTTIAGIAAPTVNAAFTSGNALAAAGTEVKSLSTDNAGATGLTVNNAGASLAIAGDANDQNFALVKNTNAGAGTTTLTASSGGTLQFGLLGQESSTKGTYTGNIALDKGTFQAVNGQFVITGTITDANNASQVLVADNTSLKTGAITLGQANSKISVGNKGTLEAIATSSVKDVTLDAGTFKVSGSANDLTVAGAVNISNGGTLESGKDLTLTGATIGNLNGASIKAVGNIAASGKNFAAGEQGLYIKAATATTGNLNGDNGVLITDISGALTSGNISANNEKGAQINVGTLATTGNVDIDSGVLNLSDKTGNSSISGTLILGSAAADKVTSVVATVTNKLTLSDNSTLLGGSSLEAKELVVTGSKILSVGSNVENSTGKLSVKVLNLANGNTLFADPAWIGTDTTHSTGYAAQVAVESFSTTPATAGTIDGKVIAGQAAQITLGDADVTWIQKKLDNYSNAHGSNIWGNGDNLVSSALGITKAINVSSTGSLFVGDAATNTSGTAGQADFASKSLLIVDANRVGAANTALTTNGNITVAADAKLMVSNATVDSTYTVATAGGTLTIDPSSWTGANLLTDHKLLAGTLGMADTDKSATVTINQRSAASVLPGLSSEMGGLIDQMVKQNHTSENSPHAGVRFANRAINRLNDNQAAATIEGAAQLAVVGAAPAMTLSAVQAGTSTVTTRTSFASPLMDSSKAVALHKDVDGTLSVDSGLNAGNGMKNGFGLWIMPLYQSNSAWGMKADGFKGGYKSDLGGVALGADYTFNDMFRLGLAFNIGGGYAESNGDFNKTENSFNFWGINAYGGWTMNNFGITADVGYTGNYNKLQQELPGSMGMGDIKSDVNSSAWTAGLRGEYKFATEALDIIPHVGVRYTGLTTDEYKAKSGGDTVFKVDQSFQSIWTFPIGVTLAKEIETGSGWIIRPQVDLGITPATGDVKAKSKVRIPGVDSQAEMKMQVVDYMSYDGGLGLEMKKDNVSFGINYNIQASEHRTGHGVFGTFRYEF